MKLASLPKSVRSAIGMVNKYNGGVPALDFHAISSQEQAAQGTRATVAQGTVSRSNTPNPLDPSVPVDGHRRTFSSMSEGWDDPTEMPDQAVFSTEGPEVPNTQSNTVQVRDWPPNPSKMIEAGATNHHLIPTEYELHSSPPPGRIPRWMPLRIFGVASQSTGVQGGEGYPWNGDWGFIPHIPVARQALGTKGPQKLSDDNVTVPAVFAGNPR